MCLLLTLKHINELLTQTRRAFSIVHHSRKPYDKYYLVF